MLEYASSDACPIFCKPGHGRMLSDGVRRAVYVAVLVLIEWCQR